MYEAGGRAGAVCSMCSAGRFWTRLTSSLSLALWWLQSRWIHAIFILTNILTNFFRLIMQTCLFYVLMYRTAEVSFMPFNNF